jgi:cell division protein FtsZ
MEDEEKAEKDGSSNSLGTNEKEQNKNYVNIHVIGIGSFGCEIGHWVRSKRIPGVEIIAINDNVNELIKMYADVKLFIDNGIPRGIGTCTNPKIGEETARRESKRIDELLGGKDVLFIISGLGGMIGSGAAPIIAEIAKKQGSLVIGAFSLPFGMEGKIRADNAAEAMEKLWSTTDTAIFIPLDMLKETIQEFEFDKLWKISSRILAEILRNVFPFLTHKMEEGSVTTDFKPVFENAGPALLGIGESDSSGGEGWEEAASGAISSPLLVLNTSEAKINYEAVGTKLVKVHEPSFIHAKTVLAGFFSSDGIRNDDLAKATDIIRGRIPQDCKIVWNAFSDPSLEGTKRCLILPTGIEIPHTSKDEQKGTRHENWAHELI